MMRIFATTLTYGLARREGRQPNHDGEFVTLFWSTDERWFTISNAGIDTTYRLQNYEQASEEAAQWLGTADTEGEFRAQLQDACELDKEIAETIKRHDEDERVTEPSEVNSSAAREAFVALGWATSREVLSA